MKLSDLPGIRSQRDPQWANVLLGWNTDPTFDLGNYGCLVTSMANYCWAIDPSNLTTSNPGLLNEALKRNGGFVQGGGDIIWSGFNQAIDTDILAQGVTSDIHALADWLNGDNHYALIQVTGSHGGFYFPEHWLMGYGVTEGTGAPDALDPWFGDACEVQGRYTFVLAHLYGDGNPLSAIPESQPQVAAPPTAQPELDPAPTPPSEESPPPTPPAETPPTPDPTSTPPPVNTHEPKQSWWQKLVAWLRKYL